MFYCRCCCAQRRLINNSHSLRFYKCLLQLWMKERTTIIGARVTVQVTTVPSLPCIVSFLQRGSQQNYEPRFIATLLHRIPVIHWLILCSQPLSVVVTRILFNNHHEQKCTKWEIRGGEYEEEEPLLIATCLVDNSLGSNCGNKFANQIVRFAFAFSFPAVVVQFNCILIT